jgi:hypothetical protein
MYGYLALKPFQVPLTEDKLILLTGALYLNMDKVAISTGSRHVLLMLMELLTPPCILLYYGVFSFGLTNNRFFLDPYRPLI